MNTNFNEEALPRPTVEVEDGRYEHGAPGLTKRELIAAMAMQGWISAAPTLNGDKARGTFEHGSRMAVAAVNYADALLAELNKEDAA